MDLKDILIIDDNGDLIKDFLDYYNNSPHIKFSTSDYEDLKRSLRFNNILILINNDGLKKDFNELTDFIRNNSFFLTVPIVVLSSDDNAVNNPNYLEMPIINHVKKPIDMDLANDILHYIIEIFESNKNTNDISGLPGNDIITKKIQQEIDNQSNFSLLYIDLDNFKEFTEYHGLYKGSRVVLTLSSILHGIITEQGNFEDFVGHVGGDDFVIILKNCQSTELIGNEIIKRFDEKIKEFYSEDDLKNKYIETYNRDGELEKIPIMGLSIITITYKDFQENSIDDVYKKLMKCKRKAKTIKGSVLLND